MILKGLRFGMLLQFAVGPICFLVFQSATTAGFLRVLPLILAVTLVDALYIALSSLGVAALLSNPKVKTTMRIVASLVLILFGINIIAGAFGHSFLAGGSIFSTSDDSLFMKGLIMTVSNPLTILFWSGMFSSKMMENEWNKKQLFFFSIGCVLATLIFLTLVAIVGSLLNEFLPAIAIKILNALIGLLVICFGVRLVLKQ